MERYTSLREALNPCHNKKRVRIVNIKGYLYRIKPNGFCERLPSGLCFECGAGIAKTAGTRCGCCCYPDVIPPEERARHAARQARMKNYLGEPA